MSIQSFVDSATHLYNDGFFDTSLCIACIAIDRCAKNKYPNLKQVEDRYKKYITDNFELICRRGLVHDCEIEKSIVFIDKAIIGDWNKDRFYLPSSIIHGLIACAKHELSINNSLNNSIE